ncbi:formate/nitrite transporter family protein [Alicyclobacillus macrosporangiidus]|jgi:formate/nitrite transporter|uniref:Formate/nitrite transporter n=1 Tax=Alicyclobacillus macrosporangiidus TaxID=392015 RepID=A0A1I7K1U7_9BACL|nr:formate/nitrite transporter family protein [Alicyclobacillus macrosporangiidus]SFU91433.1 formate/nitrite transporter [Alicyclobacillus macrosporangiidus]
MAAANFLSPAEIARLAAQAGEEKTKYGIGKLLILGFLAGAFIALGALFDIRVTAGLPDQWGTLKSLIGGAVFPIGLMFVVIAGGELLTGNMMTVPMALHERRIGIGGLVYNWLWVTIGNLVGSLFVAYGFGVLAKMLTAAPYDKATIAIAVSKASLPFFATIMSAIGCNWLVCLAVWLALGARDIVGKIFGIWFPIMGFVAIGFQHVVANMFFLPAGIFVGAHVTWGQTIVEWIGAFIGNAIGGWLFVATAYWYTLLRVPGKPVSVPTAAETSRT